MPSFTPTQVAAMPTLEKEARFAACTNDGGYGATTPLTGWDSAMTGDTSNYYRMWLEGLLWPLGEYPPGWGTHYCEKYEEAVTAAARLGITPNTGETAAQLVSRVLYSIPAEES